MLNGEAILTEAANFACGDDQWVARRQFKLLPAGCGLPRLRSQETQHPILRSNGLVAPEAQVGRLNQLVHEAIGTVYNNGPLPTSHASSRRPAARQIVTPRLTIAASKDGVTGEPGPRRLPRHEVSRTRNASKRSVHRWIPAMECNIEVPGVVANNDVRGPFVVSPY